MVLTLQKRRMEDWNPWRELEHMQRDMNRLLGTFGYSESGVYPLMNARKTEEDVVLTAELPGIQAGDIEISVTGDTLTLKGSRPEEEERENLTYHRRERLAGHFARTIQLPFHVDADKVEARFSKGVLKIRLPRTEADKPRRINIGK